MGEAAQVVLELVVFGVGCQTACAFHHETAEDGQHEDAEGEVERPGSAAAENEIYDGGTEDKDIGYPLVDAQGSLIVHCFDIIVVRRVSAWVNILFYCSIHTVARVAARIHWRCKDTKKRRNNVYLSDLFAVCCAELPSLCVLRGFCKTVPRVLKKLKSLCI